MSETEIVVWFKFLGGKVESGTSMLVLIEGYFKLESGKVDLAVSNIETGTIGTLKVGSYLRVVSEVTSISF